MAESLGGGNFDSVMKTSQDFYPAAAVADHHHLFTQSNNYFKKSANKVRPARQLLV